MIGGTCIDDLFIFLTLKTKFLFFFGLNRSRDRFLESSQQIEALVERFSRETPVPEAPLNSIGTGKIPLAYGKPSEIKVWGLLYL